MKEVEQIKEMQRCFQKCADILGKVVKLTEELEKEEDEEKMKKIESKIEENTGLFMVQMLKINSFK